MLSEFVNVTVGSQLSLLVIQSSLLSKQHFYEVSIEYLCRPAEVHRFGVSFVDPEFSTVFRRLWRSPVELGCCHNFVRRHVGFRRWKSLDGKKEPNWNPSREE